MFAIEFFEKIYHKSVTLKGDILIGWKYKCILNPIKDCLMVCHTEKINMYIKSSVYTLKSCSQNN